MAAPAAPAAPAVSAAAPPTGMDFDLSPAMQQSRDKLFSLITSHLNTEDESRIAAFYRLFTRDGPTLRCIAHFSPPLFLIGKNIADADLMELVKIVTGLVLEKSIILFREGIVRSPSGLASYIHELEGSPAYFLRLFLTHYLYDRYPDDVISSAKKPCFGSIYLHYFLHSPLFQEIWHKAWSSAEGTIHQRLMATFADQAVGKAPSEDCCLGITSENWKSIFRELALATVTEVAIPDSEKEKGDVSLRVRLVCSDDPEMIASVHTKLYPLLDSLREVEAARKVVRVVEKLSRKLRKLPRIIVIHASRTDSFAGILRSMKVGR